MAQDRPGTAAAPNPDTAAGPGDQRMRRRAQRAAATRVPLRAEHTDKARLLPDRLHLLDALPKGGAAVEIGVASGDFSAEILRRVQPDCLHLVDPWEGGRYAQGLEQVSARFADDIARGRIQLHRGTSDARLALFPPSSLDFAYLDTDHSFASTQSELRQLAPLMRPGGRIAGHDYCTGNVVKPVVYGVVEAVNAFCVSEGWQFEFLTLDSDAHFSFCLRRIGKPTTE